MLPYFLLVFVPLIAWMAAPRYRITMHGETLTDARSLPIDLFMLIFMLLIALRGLHCGNDTIQYDRLFNRYGSLSMENIFRTYDHELGFKLLCKFIYVTTGSFQLLLVVTAIICVGPLWYFYRREAEIQPLAIALFLGVAPFVMYFSGIRQAMTISMGVMAWYAARERKLIRFLLIVLAALQFHNSAFIMLPLYPLYGAKITKKWLWFVVPCMLGVFFYRTAIFNFLITFLWEEYDSISDTGAATILFLLILFSVYSYVMLEEKTLDQDTLAMRNFLLLSVVLQIFAMLHPLAMRMNYYYLIFVPILIPRIVKRCKPGFSQIARLSVVVMTTYFIYYFLINGINDNDDLNVFPYIPFWQN